MKPIYFLGLMIAFLVIVSLFLRFNPLVRDSLKGNVQDFYVGVDIAYYDLEGTQSLVNEVSSYTNLIVIGSTGVTYNVTRLDETCQYVYDRNLSFILFTEHALPRQWLENAVKLWGSRFLGLYAYDEFGGRQLDHYKYRLVQDASNSTDAGIRYVNSLNRTLSSIRGSYGSSVNLPLFSSDYGLYWFDYKAGYDVVFAEFGWNFSRQLNVALCRGAAAVQDRDWGVMITWTYDGSPYIESGDKLFEDMTLAYNNGAKYIIVFDSNYDYSQGILKQEHLTALKQFWEYTKSNPRTKDAVENHVAYVLPENFGYGFRGPTDKIWGMWEADAPSKELCSNLNGLLEQYGTNLDIIYDDSTKAGSAVAYSKLVFWNGTVQIR